MPNRLLTFARFAPNRYTQLQLLACLLVKEYLGLDYRTAQETLELSDSLREALGLGRGGSKAPPLVAIDSTGLYCGHASRYFERRRPQADRRERRAYQK